MCCCMVRSMFVCLSVRVCEFGCNVFVDGVCNVLCDDVHFVRLFVCLVACVCVLRCVCAYVL